MQAFFQRLQYAIQGWKYFFANETNGQIQAVVAILVVGFGWWLQIAAHEWLVVLLCIALVLGLEMANTAVEKMADHLHPERHPQIKIVKDVAAGAVLFAAVMSAIAGVIIFLPRLLSLLQ
jgi:diacylglycerol kinase